MNRGEIWLVNLDPTVGSEIKKSRPCVIVSSMTSKGFAAPFRVPLADAGIKGSVVLEQLRTVDKVRLAKKMGQVSAKTLTQCAASPGVQPGVKSAQRGEVALPLADFANCP